MTTDYLAIVKPEDVKDAESLCVFTHQTLGTPPARIKDIIAVKSMIKEFFTLYPRADYNTLVRTIQFAARRNARPKDIHAALYWWRKAWAAGELPELDPLTERDQNLEEKIKEAIGLETHSRWIDQLNGALWFHGDDIRQEVYSAWEKDRLEANLPVPK